MAEYHRFAERFQIFIAGMECGYNRSEQNDPARLLETWQKRIGPTSETGKISHFGFRFY